MPSSSERQCNERNSTLFSFTKCPLKFKLKEVATDVFCSCSTIHYVSAYFSTKFLIKDQYRKMQLSRSNSDNSAFFIFCCINWGRRNP